MIPKQGDELQAGFTKVRQPSKAFLVDGGTGRIRGYCDGVEALKQAIAWILSVERYENPIYSWNYGTELNCLFGSPAPLVYPKLEHSITEALLQDDRIRSVHDFTFSRTKRAVAVSFTVESIYGTLKERTEVEGLV